jgi:raffinose/stachyose/melibiose transport system permease protein
MPKSISDHRDAGSIPASKPPDLASSGRDAVGSRGRKRFGGRHLHAFAVPSVALVAVFFVAPFMLNGWFAFTQWTGFSARITFNGLDNFRLLDQLDLLSHAIRVTIIYAVVVLIVQNTVSLTLALALQKTNAVNSAFRSVFFVPVLISPLDPSGPINAFLGAVLPGDVDYAWLGHDLSALITVAAIDAWKWSGLITLVYIAGLNSIPESLIDAAAIDGAGRWRRFWAIKFPLLAPAFTFNVVVTLVGAFSAFDIVFSTTHGGPGNATTLLNVAMYQQYGQSFFGSASALSLVVTVIAVATAVPLITWLRRREVSM